jgi:hypothetical protein
MCVNLPFFVREFTVFLGIVDQIFIMFFGNLVLLQGSPLGVSLCEAKKTFWISSHVFMTWEKCICGMGGRINQDARPQRAH